LLGQTARFFSEQSKQMEVEHELDNPIFIPQLTKEIHPEFISLLHKYSSNISERVHKYKGKIEEIDKKIE
jgi:hypothetical protein